MKGYVRSTPCSIFETRRRQEKREKREGGGRENLRSEERKLTSEKRKRVRGALRE